MKIHVGHGDRSAEERLQANGVSRRDFMKFCAAVSAVLGLGASGATEVAAALTQKRRPSVVYLHCAECTGCSESVLRAVQPIMIDDLILDTISLDYHETLMAAAGEKAEEALHSAINNPDGFICVVEGAIPMKDGGIYGKVAGKTMYDLVAEVAPKAKAVIAIGNCANFGGVQAAKPNPTGAKGVNDAFKDKGIKAINIGGCPPNPYNFVGAVVLYLQGKKIELDEYSRPLAFYGETVHDHCPRQKYFDQGMFAPSFDSEEARKGYCLYELGCRGPYTFNNCPTVKFNQTNWPVEAGHPCIGCSEPNFWDAMSPFYVQM
ncbi:hydrogenase (NiFe) small subunit HydA [Desulfovibrio sp. X2]|uniref:hydrogenase small subunit n=1 Tax=Desulfovibrio sp. X2 TaxID=941449 RepID=UPI000358DFE7|nr:hydrogenase small subunit [Desulfovibrio sp. X2]EPR42214.1 hydrogenase (NiFe) small subunit HydA [Desulfovibrio sp. X2]